MLAQGANPKTRSVNGTSALTRALANGSRATATILLNAGAPQ